MRYFVKDFTTEAHSGDKVRSSKTHCRVLKLADKPSGLEGGGYGIKSSLFGDLTAPWRFEPSLYSNLDGRSGFSLK
jgi:hypothetical protein